MGSICDTCMHRGDCDDSSTNPDSDNYGVPVEDCGDYEADETAGGIR